MGQQSEGEGAQHTSVGAPVFSATGSAGSVVAHKDCLWSPSQEVKQPDAQHGVEPHSVQFVNDLLGDDPVEC